MSMPITLSDKLEIQEFDVSPMSMRRFTGTGMESHTDDSSEKKSTPPADGVWPKKSPPRRKNEKSVFKFLKETDTNYTIRRQEMQISALLKKNQRVKAVCASN